jgi:hypothetical protein
MANNDVRYISHPSAERLADEHARFCDHRNDCQRRHDELDDKAEHNHRIASFKRAVSSDPH